MAVGGAFVSFNPVTEEEMVGRSWCFCGSYRLPGTTWGTSGPPGGSRGSSLREGTTRGNHLAGVHRRRSGTTRGTTGEPPVWITVLGVFALPIWPDREVPMAAVRPVLAADIALIEEQLHRVEDVPALALDVLLDEVGGAPWLALDDSGCLFHQVRGAERPRLALAHLGHGLRKLEGAATDHLFQRRRDAGEALALALPDDLPLGLAVEGLDCAQLEDDLVQVPLGARAPRVASVAVTDVVQDQGGALARASGTTRALTKVA